MKVIFLAAGRSRRMDPVPDKNFLELCGKTLISWQFEALAASDFCDIFIIGGAHNIEKLREFAKNPDTQRPFGDKKANITVLEQADLDTGMAGAVLTAKSSVLDEPVLVVNSNDILDPTAFSTILSASQDPTFSSFLLAKKVSEYFPGGYLETAKDGSLQNIVEKPPKGKEPSDLVNIVVHFHRNAQKLFQYLEKTHSDRDDRYEMALGSMMRDGIRMKAVPYNGFWQAIKYPWHLLPAAQFFFDRMPKGISKTAVVSASAHIHGEVILGENVRVLDNAVISGPAYIGDNTVIATNALVRGSFIGKNCVIGFGSEVARSWLGNSVWTHTNYVGDSVICDNVSFGSGAVTGNLRLDEKNICVEANGKKIDCGSNKMGAIIGPDVRVGINASLMPGIKIGAGSFIGAGMVVGRDIPEGHFVKGKWELEIVPNKASVDSKSREKMQNAMKKIVCIAGLFFATLFVSAPNVLAEFNDIPTDSWYYDAVQTLLKNLVIDEVPAFRPNDPITRAEFVKMLLLAAGFPILNTKNPTFNDVPEEAWYYSYIETAVYYEIVSGNADNDGNKIFRPNDKISRAEAVKMIVKAFSLPEIYPLLDESSYCSDIEKSLIAACKKNISQIKRKRGLSDVPIESWYRPYVETASYWSIVSGYGNSGRFKPSASVNRAETAKMLVAAQTPKSCDKCSPKISLQEIARPTLFCTPFSDDDVDGDEIYNDCDACPFDRGTVRINGCPDRIISAEEFFQEDVSVEVTFEQYDKETTTLTTELPESAEGLEWQYDGGNSGTFLWEANKTDYGRFKLYVEAIDDRNVPALYMIDLWMDCGSACSGADVLE